MKKIETPDLTRWSQGVQLLEKRARDILGTSPSKSDELFYDLYHKFFKRVKDEAEEGGHRLIAFNTSVPTEIVYAMDLVPVLVVNSTFTMTVALEDYRENLDIASGYGLATESCSAHRQLAAYFVEGWFPRPKAFIEMGPPVCDAFNYSHRFGHELYRVAHYTVDRPYYYTEENVKHLAGEFEDMIHFLEEQTGRKIDWDKLKEVVAQSVKMVELQREIHRLRKAVPSPIENVRPVQINWLQWIYAGMPEGIAFLTAVRDEIKERVEHKKGVALPEERYRLLNLFHPLPLWCLGALLNWMQNEKGAVYVMEMFLSWWGKGELDPSNPLECLARKVYLQPFDNIVGPIEKHVANAIKAAKEYKVDGAIREQNFACRQSPHTRVLKDALMEEAGIPTLIPDIDVLDPTYSTLDEIKDKYEEFFEALDERKSR